MGAVDDDTRTDVIAVLHRLGQAITDADADAVIAEFSAATDVAMFGSEHPEIAFGPAELANLWRGILSRDQCYIWNWRNERVAAAGPVAWLTAEATVTIRDASVSRELDYRATLVLVREAGQWVIALYHGSEPAGSW